MRSKKRSLPAVFLVSLLVAGCGGGYYGVDPIFTREPSATDGSTIYARASIEGQFGTHVVVDFESPAFKDRLRQARATQNARNDLLLNLLMFSDRICTGHLSSIKGTSSEINVGLGAMTSLFSALATITAGTAAKTYAATSTVTNASRSLVNEEVYRQHFADAVVGKINENREAKRKAIVSGFTKTLQSYPIEVGVTDLIDYHEECSFYRGAATLVDAAKKRPAATEDAKGDAGQPADPTTVVNPIVADAKVKASLATLAGGFSNVELQLVDVKTGVTLPGLWASGQVVTGTSVEFSVPADKAKTFAAGTQVKLQSLIRKTPSGLPIARESGPAVFYGSAKDAAIAVAVDPFDAATGKITGKLTFPKSHDLAYPTLPSDKKIKVTVPDNDKAKFKDAACTLDKDGACAFSLEPDGTLDPSVGAKNFKIKLIMNFEAPALAAPEIDVAIKPKAN